MKKPYAASGYAVRASAFMKDFLRAGLKPAAVTKEAAAVTGSEKYTMTETKQSTQLNKQHDVAALTYVTSDLSDIIHPFSEPGYEVLSETFVSFLERNRPVLPGKVPVVLSLTGRDFSAEERTAVDRAMWSHFGLKLTQAKEAWHSCCLRMLVYAVYLVLSSVLLFWVSNIKNELITNLAYMPFWFFGYRLLSRLFLDCYPIRKDFEWYRRLSNVKLVFQQGTETPEVPIGKDLNDEIRGYDFETMDALYKNVIVKKYLLDNGAFTLSCRVSGLADVLSPNYPEDRPVLSDALGGFLSLAFPFLPEGGSVTLNISGAEFTEKEKEDVRCGIRNYFSLCLADEESEKRNNRRLSLLFSGLLLVSTVLLAFLGSYLDVAGHEFVMVLFWFFGDYLLEFLLLSPIDINSNRKKWKAYADMKVNF